MEHINFALINFVFMGLILIVDKKDLKTYMRISLIGLILAFVFETVTTYIGFWSYAYPTFGIISFYTWILYAPYLCMCYFLGRRLQNA